MTSILCECLGSQLIFVLILVSKLCMGIRCKSGVDIDVLSSACR